MEIPATWEPVNYQVPISDWWELTLYSDSGHSEAIPSRRSIAPLVPKPSQGLPVAGSQSEEPSIGSDIEDPPVRIPFLRSACSRRRSLPVSDAPIHNRATTGPTSAEWVEDPKLSPRLRIQGDGLAGLGREVEDILHHQGSAFESDDFIAGIGGKLIRPRSLSRWTLVRSICLSGEKPHAARVVGIRTPFPPGGDRVNLSPGVATGPQAKY